MATDAQLKLGRAGEHIAVVEELVETWLPSDEFTIERVQGEDGRIEQRVRLTGAPPPEIAVIAGEAVHCLHSPLDNAVYATARDAADGPLDPETEESLQFPVFRWRKNARRRSRRRPPSCGAVAPLPLEHRRRAQGLPLPLTWRVHDLDRIDKHRRLALTAAAVGTPGSVSRRVSIRRWRR